MNISPGIVNVSVRLQDEQNEREPDEGPQFHLPSNALPFLPHNPLLDEEKKER
jgi:hypothetical protein